MVGLGLALLEKFPGEVEQLAGFPGTLLHFGVEVLGAEEVPLPLHQVVVRGLQRLLLSFSLGGAECSALAHAATAQLDKDHPQRGLSAFSLLLTCMYCGREGTGTVPIDRDPGTLDSLLAGAMDKMRKMLDCVGHCCPAQAGPLAAVLPYLIHDFFPAEQLLNTLVSELLSPRQQNRALVALLVRALLCASTQMADWVVLVLRTVVQLRPVGGSVWSSCVLLLAACQDGHLAALLPWVLHHTPPALHSSPHAAPLLTALARDFLLPLAPADKQLFREVLTQGASTHSRENERNTYVRVLEAIQSE